MAEQNALSRDHARLPPIHLDAIVDLTVVEESGSSGGSCEHEARPRVHEDGEPPLLVTAEEGIPDEFEREAVARDEEEGDLGVPRRQRRLLDLRLRLGNSCFRRRRRGLQRRGGAMEKQEEQAAEAEAEQQQQQQRRRAPDPAVAVAVAVAEPPRLHPDGRGGWPWPPPARGLYLRGMNRAESGQVSAV